jgi:hypothetical protein
MNGPESWRPCLVCAQPCHEFEAKPLHAFQPRVYCVLYFQWVYGWERVFVCVQAILLDTSHIFILASSSQRGKKGLVLTDCTCASLYPESGYIVYSRKIFSKLSMSSLLSARIWPTNAWRELEEFGNAQAVGWPARTKRLTLAHVWASDRITMQ